MRKYAEILAELRQKLTYCMGENIGISYPMPDIENGTRIEKQFLYRKTLALTRSRPFALITVSMDDGALLSYQDCRFRDFMEPEGHGFNQKINYALPKKQDVKEYATKQSLLRKMYEVVRQAAFSETLTQQEKELIGKYLSLLREQVPADLLEYYEKAGENFYRWVKKNV